VPGVVGPPGLARHAQAIVVTADAATVAATAAVAVRVVMTVEVSVTSAETG
jgi:hypothetical protein